VKTFRIVLAVLAVLAILALVLAFSVPVGESAKPEYAYLLVFQNITQWRCKYLAADLTDVKLKDTTYLVELLQKYCDDRGVTLLLDDYYGLEEKGYINDDWNEFEDGLLITFHDKSLTKNKLVTEASLYCASLAGQGRKYVVKRTFHEWKITSIEMMWIS